ncbi:MAG: hypothetical protein JXR83_15340 [Deltaproteobacteria bacterium]|nr:hypothetical protein [Deltaproteobacteria bacterium]
MLRLLVGFVVGVGLTALLVYAGVVTPRTVRDVTKDPGRGLSEMTDNAVRQVKEEAKNLRTNAEAAAMVKGRAGQDASCRREGLSTNHVCRTRDGTLYRVVGDDVVQFKGDLRDLDPDLTAWLKQGFEERAATLPGHGSATP